MLKKLLLILTIVMATSFAFMSCDRKDEIISPPPTEIAAYVESTYPDAEIIIVKYDKHDKEYEVTLSNGWELTFDENFRLIDADR